MEELSYAHTSQEIHKYFICVYFPGIGKLSFTSYQFSLLVLEEDLKHQITELKGYLSHVGIRENSIHYLSIVDERSFLRFVDRSSFPDASTSATSIRLFPSTLGLS